MNGPDIDNTSNLQPTSDYIHHPPNYNTGQDSPSWYTLHPWPGELSDAMMWSAQFLDPNKVVHQDGVSGSAPDMLKYAPTEGTGHRGDLS